MILLLSSYGSPSAITVPPTPGSFLVILYPENRIFIWPLPNTSPLIGLYFTRKEFDDIFRQFCQNFVNSGQPFLLSEDASNYIWKFTNGHPSAVRLLLEYLANSVVYYSSEFVLTNLIHLRHYANSVSKGRQFR